MRILKVALTTLLILPLLVNAGMVTGSYVGTGTGTYSVTGLGITPVMVLVKVDGLGSGWIATNTMTAGEAMKLTASTGPETGLISSLDADGFTVDKTDLLSNESGVTYYYVTWDASSITTGSFSPNDCATAWSSSSWYSAGAVVSNGSVNYQATAGHTSSALNEPGVGPTEASYWTSLGACGDFDEDIFLGFEPAMMWLFGGTSTWYEVTYPQLSMNGAQPTYSHRFNNGARVTSANYKILNDFTTTGFQTTTSSVAGTHSGPSVGVTYHYAAFGGTIGSYAGNNSVEQDITTSASPDFVIVKNVEGSSDNNWWKTKDMESDESFKFTGAASTLSINGISSSPNQFTVNTNGEVNGIDDYEYLIMANVSGLPVELISFDAEKFEGGVYVSWETATEINNEYFEVLASADGLNWEVIGTVAGAGNSTEVNGYYLMDYKIEGLDFKYYKLAQYDFDGTKTISDVKLVNFTNKSLVDFSAFEDGENINIQFNGSTENMNLSIYDVKGKLISVGGFDAENSNNNLLTVTKNSISQGIYFVRLTNGVDTYSTKLLVK